MNNFERLTAEELIDKLKAEIEELSKLDPISPIALRYYKRGFEGCIADIDVDVEGYNNKINFDKTIQLAKDDISFATAVVDAWVSKTNDEDDLLWDTFENSDGNEFELSQVAKNNYDELLAENAETIDYVELGDEEDDDCEDEEG